ncbi:hypothetical protein MJO28_016166 [Puccinia striiformis f. sp. tritici]|uniref:RRM domain-containing protein n=4 Tax=Puccinia striiformis TaxID=27350 RepID=A0A0L0W233_9BASI|nr:hypothetical protein Pst134EA_028803 [Puccinia striiformis f. sp. tritici]KAI9623487.1 hypothetical protein H4Q26_014660 [Puccinia striiformis f. sp. tritici PST-130]KNF05564.1 hypothetical protein PSTG_01374 [Puccinia striiformis f. sp. tritici PST-78]POV94965.1 hypothetical protein PSHT_15919 [Puccinia striiformis]KAH9440863.1 hypothetical protein Pst134EB_029516 [Puccinia striiformis f. sp. tritici]KAH9446814.1 hypothetical protein Pst134EA_028803 [Puccinia striiformis f. sp. tritici]
MEHHHHHHWLSSLTDQSKLDDFQFHLGEQTAPENSDFDEHSSSSAIAYLRLPPVHPPSPTNIFLANFPKTWSEFDLAQIFDGIPILTVHVIRDKIAPNAGGGFSRGVGFVNVLYKHEAVALVQHLDRKIWLDVEAPLKIRLAKATAPNPKVDIDVNGMMDPATRQKEGELSPGRRIGPKVNLLKELEIVVSLAKRPVQSSTPFTSKSPTVPGGLYNLWEPMACNVQQRSPSGLPFYTKLEPTHFPTEINQFHSMVHSSPNSSVYGPKSLYGPKHNIEPYPSQWASWQSNQESMKPMVFERCPPIKCDLPYSHGLRQSSTPVHHITTTPTYSVPDSSSSSGSWPGSSFDYGFIGGPAVDLLSGAVISPRRHQRNSSPTSSEDGCLPRSI